MDRALAFRREHYTEMVARLTAACDGLRIDRGRASLYAKLVREIFEDDARSRQHILGISESFEVVDLFELWEHRVVEFHGLIERLRAALGKGPLLREDENIAASSNRARNDVFPLLVAGRLLAAGIPVVAVEGILARGETLASEADLTFRWSGTIFDIECKRPQSYVALGERMAEARAQIGRPSREGRSGVIAIDCSVLLRPAGTLLETDSVARAEALVSGQLEKSIAVRVVSYLPSSIPGLLLFARVPVMTRLRRSPILTALGQPIDDFRPDCISTWLVVSNAQYTGADVLRELARRLLQSDAARPEGHRRPLRRALEFDDDLRATAASRAPKRPRADSAELTVDGAGGGRPPGED